MKLHRIPDPAVFSIATASDGSVTTSILNTINFNRWYILPSNSDKQIFVFTLAQMKAQLKVLVSEHIFDFINKV